MAFAVTTNMHTTRLFHDKHAPKGNNFVVFCNHKDCMFARARGTKAQALRVAKEHEEANK